MMPHAALFIIDKIVDHIIMQTDKVYYLCKADISNKITPTVANVIISIFLEYKYKLEVNKVYYLCKYDKKK